MHVRVQQLYRVSTPTPEGILTWLGQEHAEKAQEIRADARKLAVLSLFLQHWDMKYGFLESLVMLKHFEMYYEQVELLCGFRDLGEQIRQLHPPHQFIYVGVGRSPAPLMAYFENQNIEAVTIPLSSFRPRNTQWSVTNDVLSGAPLTPLQQQNLFAHFVTFFAACPTRDLLIIDFGVTSQSLVAAQEQLQEYFRSRQFNVGVHALALCRDSDAPQARAIGDWVGTVRYWFLHPIDRWYYSDRRRQFKQQWHVLPLAAVGQQTLRQRLVMAALSGQRFDALAEYDSFPILDANAPPHPTRYTLDPNHRAAYDALREEFRNL